VDDATVLAVFEVVYSTLFNYVSFSDLGLYSVLRVGNRVNIYTTEDFREATPFRDVGNVRIVVKKFDFHRKPALFIWG